jgi:predicted cupin superfamily sugar epimerase
MEKLTADTIIEKFNLSPHEETGFYKEIFRSKSEEGISTQALSSILFLTKGGTSTFFRILSESDEIVCFHEGKSFEIFCIDTLGNFILYKLGRDILNGEVLQAVIPKDYIASFKTRMNTDTEHNFSLFGCICGPAFSYERFRILKDEEVAERFPKIGKELINTWRKDYTS